MFRTLLPALALTFAAAPALADQVTETPVSFEIELASAPTDTLASIEAQAWTACAPTRGSASVFDRSQNVRRACQDGLVRDVVSALSDPDVTAALDARETNLEG